MGELLHDWWMILAALIPSIGLLFLFWVILKNLIEGDRRERAAIRQWEAEQEAAEASSTKVSPASAAKSGSDSREMSEDVTRKKPEKSDESAGQS